MMFRNLLLLLIFQFASGYRFDKSSCDSFLPVPDNDKQTGINNNGETPIDLSSAGEIPYLKGENYMKKKKFIKNKDVTLLPAREPSPYQIHVSSLNYRRNRIMSITVYGSNFTGLFIQARRRFQSSFDTRPIAVGNFVQLPPGFQTLDCNSSPSPYPASTAVTSSFASRPYIDLNWKGPLEDFDSIQFVATVVRDKFYWTHVNSLPLFFNEFPPNIQECGYTLNCRQYALPEQDCELGLCDFIVTSFVDGNEAVFNIGGRIGDNLGYVGIGFCKDNLELSFLDMYMCMKTDERRAQLFHFGYNKSVNTLTKWNDADYEKAEADKIFTWCKFRLPLRPQKSSKLDYSKLLYSVLFWGDVNPQNLHPFLPDEITILNELRIWNRTQALNDIHYISDGHTTVINWISLLILVIIALLFQ